MKMASISSDRERAEELMRRLEVLKVLKAAGQLEEEDRRGLLFSPPREEFGFLERQRQRIKKIQESKQDTAEGSEESHVDAEGVGKMRKKVGLEKGRRGNPLHWDGHHQP